jgi:integron integrase
MQNNPPRLLDQVRNQIRLKHYSIRTEEAYIGWIRRFILFHNKRHPKEMGRVEIEAFLTDLAVNRHVAASTQNQAFNAILFLYRNVLEMDMPDHINAMRAKRPEKVPVVLSTHEVSAVLSAMTGTCRLIAKIQYGAGLRGIEVARLRIKDIDFDRNEITVRRGKGDKDRITMLPKGIKAELIEHIQYVESLHKKDLAEGFGAVFLPNALERKYHL